MRITVDSARGWITRRRFQVEAVGLAALVTILSGAVGAAARSKIAQVRTERARLSASLAEASSFRAAFQPSPDLELARMSDSLQIGVLHIARTSLVQLVAERAEGAGLGNVRVRFAPADSAPPPRTPELITGAPVVADYAVAVDCDGGFAAVLSLVNQLPPSLALERLTATASEVGTARYHLTFAVFEIPETNRHG